VIGFAEILRSESKKEVVQALANTYNLAPTLPRFVVYDAGCLIVKFIKANFNNPNRTNSIYVTPETKILHDEIKWMIDRFHLLNHIDVCIVFLFFSVCYKMYIMSRISVIQNSIQIVNQL